MCAIHLRSSTTPFPSVPVLRVYLARHGRTHWNARGRLQGSIDIPLDAVGRQQAQLLADRLRGIPLQAIYCSEQARSRQTAESLRHCAPITVWTDLNERRLGEYEGVRLREKDDAFVNEYRRRVFSWDDSLGGGESFREHQARVRQVWTRLLEQHPAGQVLVIGHGATNAQLMRIALGRLEPGELSVKQRNDEIFLLEVWPQRTPLLWRWAELGVTTPGQ